MLQGVGTTAVYNSGDYHYASGCGWELLLCITVRIIIMLQSVGTTAVYNSGDYHYASGCGNYCCV